MRTVSRGEPRPILRNAKETIMIDRRILLASVAGLFGFMSLRWLRAAPAQAAEKFEIEKTEAEWRAQLTPQQYAILREEGTERPNSSPLLKEHRKGIFACAGCDLPLFSSETKFESGTGWPSFYQPLPNAVGKHEDRTFGMLRTEIHCRRCGGHLGHVFDDGPKPTGLRYCMDGFALQFHPAAAQAS
jgi:peptide-methionine (R)-S-oxide reductase